MREPKTPLPWVTTPTRWKDLRTRGADGKPVMSESPGGFEDMCPKGADHTYAVHAANALPEVLAALRKWVQIAEDAVRVHEKRHEPEQAYQWKLWRNDFRAALAKAEGAPEGNDAARHER